MRKYLSNIHVICIVLVTLAGIALSLWLQHYFTSQRVERARTEFESMVSNYTVLLQHVLDQQDTSLQQFADFHSILHVSSDHAVNQAELQDYYERFGKAVAVAAWVRPGSEGSPVPFKQLASAGNQQQVAGFTALLNEPDSSKSSRAWLQNVQHKAVVLSRQYNSVPVLLPIYRDPAISTQPDELWLKAIDIEQQLERTVGTSLPEWLDIYLYAVSDDYKVNTFMFAYTSGGRNLAPMQPEEFDLKETVFLPGALHVGVGRFSVAYAPIKGYRHGISGWQPYVIAVFGVFISIALALYLFSLLQRTKKINDLVDLRTYALRKSEERFLLAVEGANDGIWDWPDISIDKQYWSPHFYELLGYESNEITASAKTFKDFMHPEDKIKKLGLTERSISEKTSYRVEFRLRNKEGNYRWFRSKGVCVPGEDGKVARVAGSISDIQSLKDANEEKSKMEIQLQEAKKLESVGQLAAGVAHEINTPIQFVGDNVQFLKDSFNDLQELIGFYEEMLANEASEDIDARKAKIEEKKEDLDVEYLYEEVPQAISQAADGIDRVSTIVKAMKEFSHPGSEEKQHTDLNHAIESTITVSRNEWKYVAEMETNFDSRLPNVQCFAGEINQTILNIIVNAAHAITEVKNETPGHQGKISITTKHIGDSVEIIISDNGGGMPNNVRERVFDPFFTTKEVGKGTGQGLYIAYSVVVEKHSGSIRAESEQGVGTQFVITLPINAPQQKTDLADIESGKVA